MTKAQGLRVLLVGERPGAVTSLCCPLRADGHLIEIATDVDIALGAARVALPDIVILDWDSPGLDAPDVAQRIHELASWRHPFFIAFAGRDNPDTARPLHEDGIDLHFLKPLDVTHVRALLLRFQTLVRDMEAFDPVI